MKTIRATKVFGRVPFMGKSSARLHVHTVTVTGIREVYDL